VQAGGGTATPGGGPADRPVGHYFSVEPDARSDRHEVSVTLPDGPLTLVTDRGVFAGAAVDRGTQLLLRTVPPPTGREVVDVGCGYGPIAVAVARRAPAARVWAVDVNRRALELTRLNAERAGLPGVVPVLAEDVPADLRVDTVYSNPPIRIGKPALHALLLFWLARLTPGGVAYLVVQKHLGSDSLARWLVGQGHPTERIAARESYRVLKVGAGAAAQ
jgi:16S rRNA (guanine1207-N2)-methyltransferase